ncbi:hypothetical protein T484DRAFT_1860160 [Baffinella frigidus]|nr:hypothetical protein T484DRAFT_1860160 [Cryptophyta sp. CCMP2293]
MLYTKRVTLVFLTQFVCTLSFVIYCLLIVINFAEMFHSNLARIHHKRETDAWLQARCKEQEFVHHIRHHIDLCETVEREAQTNGYLIAMQLALDGLHLCGSYSCEKILIALTESLRLSIYTWIASITAVFILYAGIATLLVFDPYMLYQYSWYMATTIAPSPDPGWNPMQTYSPPTAHWTAPWTSFFGLTTMLVVSVVWVGVTHRIKPANVEYKAGACAVILASHAIYWFVYLWLKQLKAAWLLCCALLWLAMVLQEYCSLCGANGFTEMEVSNMRDVPCSC